MKNPEPWQLVVFNLSIRKKNKWRWAKPQLQTVVRPTSRGLDVGSGVGTLSILQEQLGGRWEFIETDPAAAQETATIVKGSVLVADIFDPRLKAGTYDIITLFDVIEHVPHPDRLMQRAAELLKPRGSLILTTPADDTHFYFWRRLAERLFGIDKAAHGHMVEGFSRPQLEQLCEGAKFDLKRCDAFSFFFTEMVELMYNGAYILKNRRRQGTTGYNLALSPASGADVNRHQSQLQILRFIYPFLASVAALDHFFPFRRGYEWGIVAVRR